MNELFHDMHDFFINIHFEKKTKENVYNLITFANFKMQKFEYANNYIMIFNLMTFANFMMQKI